MISDNLTISSSFGIYFVDIVFNLITEKNGTKTEYMYHITKLYLRSQGQIYLIWAKSRRKTYFILHGKSKMRRPTLDRWQSKTLSTIDERGSKIDRNSVFDCQCGDK